MEPRIGNPAFGSPNTSPAASVGVPHRLSEPGTACRSPTSALYWASELCVGHRNPEDRSPISSISTVGYWSSILEIAAPHHPQIRHWLSEPFWVLQPYICPVMLHWVSELHVGHRGLTLGVRAWHWVPEPHIHPIMGIGALHWALEPILGILAPYQPCIHPQVPEPLVG